MPGEQIGFSMAELLFMFLFYHIDRFKVSDEPQLIKTVLWGEMML